MDFSTELNIFPSAVHKEIYSAAHNLKSLEKSLSNIENLSIRLSCIDFYGFILDMYSDMYDYPEEHNLPIGMLEKFCDGKKLNGMKQKFPSKAKKIIALTIHPERSYIQFLCMLGKYGVLKDEILVLSPNNLEIIKKFFKIEEDNILLDKKFNPLERIGLLFQDNGFVSKNHPRMFSSMYALARKTEKLSGFNFFMNFYTLDFRNINEDYRATYEDYFDVLFDEGRKYADILHDYAIQNKLNPAINLYWKVDYTYKGKKVMSIATHDQTLTVHILGTYYNDDSALINDRLSKESLDFQKQVLRHVRRCDACATTHLGMFVTVLGKRQRVCGGGETAFRWSNPTESDLNIIKKLIQLRIEIINEII